MKLLFTNELKNASFSSLNENTSFPLTSLVHQFLRYKYKATTFEDTITITLPNNVKADSFWYGYSNATSMSVEIYSNLLVLLATITVDCTRSNGAEYFTELENVRVIKIIASSSVENDLQIGGLAFGMSSQFPFPLATFEKTLVQNTDNDTTESGQVFSQYVEPLVKYDLNYNGINKTDYDDVVALFYSIGKGHVWCDITEGDHSVYSPIYSVTSLIESPIRSNARISFKITFLEAR